MIKNITFSAVDAQLQEAENAFDEVKVNLEILYKRFNLENFDVLDEAINNISEYNLAKKINNPQIIVIIRDKSGKIINENDLGKITEYISEIKFDDENLDNVYKIKLGDEYNYRALNFVVKASESYKDKYVQLLINVDSEIVLINSYMEIIIYAVTFCVILSGIASFVLSKKTLKPIQDTLRNQTEFVQNASHELRTPLTIIQAKQELLLQEPNARIIDKSEDIALTLSETKRLSKLIKDLMILVRGSNIKLQKEDVNVDEFITNIMQPYKEIATAQEKEIILNLKFGKEIAMDTNKIHQLLVILLDNSIKYTEAGDKIQINTYFKDNKCVIEVCDTGIGISDEGLNKIFHRFYREDRARNRETGRKWPRIVNCYNDSRCSWWNYTSFT
jgi:two-component system sensor histidine kinase CiaH